MSVTSRPTDDKCIHVSLSLSLSLCVCVCVCVCATGVVLFTPLLIEAVPGIDTDPVSFINGGGVEVGQSPWSPGPRCGLCFQTPFGGSVRSIHPTLLYLTTPPCVYYYYRYTEVYVCVCVCVVLLQRQGHINRRSVRVQRSR